MVPLKKRPPSKQHAPSQPPRSTELMSGIAPSCHSPSKYVLIWPPGQSWVPPFIGIVYRQYVHARVLQDCRRERGVEISWVVCALGRGL